VTELPRCSDPDDQKFLALAAAAGAAALVSKDRAVLKLRRRCAPWFRILTPAEAAQTLASRPPASAVS
jgi:predicted nucleic acid-binding protein